MNQREVTTEEIRDIAFRTTGESHSSDWKAYRDGKLTSSKFGRSISVMRNPDPTNLQRLRDELYVPKNLDQVGLSDGGWITSRWRWTRIRTRLRVSRSQPVCGCSERTSGCIARWTGLHRPSRRVCCGHPRSQVPLFDARCERGVARRVAQLSELSRLQQQSQEIPRLLSSNPRGDGSGSGGVVRLCHLDSEQHEDSTHPSR